MVRMAHKVKRALKEKKAIKVIRGRGVRKDLEEHKVKKVKRASPETRARTASKDLMETTSRVERLKFHRQLTKMMERPSVHAT